MRKYHCGHFADEFKNDFGRTGIKIGISFIETKEFDPMISPTLPELKRLIGRGVALVDFDLPWCASGRIQEKIMDSLARQFDRRASVVAVNVDKIESIAVAFDIHHVPTLILFKKGKEIKRFIGLHPEETLRQATEKALKS